MVVGFTTTCASSVYHHKSCKNESRWWRGVLDTILCDSVFQWLATGRLFSPVTPVSSTNKTDLYYITQMVLKVAQTTIPIIPNPIQQSVNKYTFLRSKNCKFWQEHTKCIQKCTYLLRKKETIELSDIFIWNRRLSWRNIYLVKICNLQRVVDGYSVGTFNISEETPMYRNRNN